MPLGEIDRASKYFPYEQIVRHIREMIDTGEYEPGRLLPSEQYLKQHYGVARETVRKAILALKLEGYVDVRQARGMFVVDKPPNPDPES